MDGTALTPAQQVAEADDSIAIEDFIRANNARDRGEAVPPLKEIEEPTEEAPPAPAKPIPPPTAPTETPEPEPAVAATPERKPSRRHDPRAAVQAAVAKQREAERVAEEARARAAQLEAQLQQQRSPAAQQSQPPAPTQPVYDGHDPQDPEPTLQQFAAEADPYTARMDARMAWAARKESRRLLAMQNQLQQRQQAEALYQQRVTALQKKFGDYERVDPTFRDRIDPGIARAMTWTTPDAYGTPLGDLVMDSENPAELMLYFSDHRDDFQRIAALHPLLAGVALGEIKGRLAAAKSQRPSARTHVSNANPPIKPPAGSMTTSDEIDDAEDLSEDAVIRHIRRGNAHAFKHRNLRRLR